MKNKWKTYMTWLLPGFLILVTDRIFKMLFYDAETTLIPGVLALTGAQNTGMAMGMFTGHPVALVLLTVFLAVICVAFLRAYRITGFAAVSLSLIAGGALGNALDRVFYGYVIDMIELLFIDFFIFNIADMGVVCGAFLCGYSLLFRSKEWRER